MFDDGAAGATARPGPVEDARTLTRIARTLPPGDGRVDELRRIAAREIDQMPPIRVSIAAKVLGVSAPTVRDWVRRSILIARSHEPRLVLEPESVVEVLEVLLELRRIRRDRNLTDAVFHRLADDDLLSDPELVASLEHMRRGEGRVRRSRNGEGVVGST